MSKSRYSSLQTSIQKTNELIKEIQREFGWESRPDQAYAALRVVLQTLRDRLPVNEAVDLGAELPMLIRGMYYDGWQPSHVPKKMHREEFLGEIRRKFQYAIEPEELIQGVFTALKRFIAIGELNDIKDVLPDDIASILP